ncbi:hypothetical protein [Massilia sp. erpn]|uniref:hypothetical protein n=1 Tax=Massilia sp. erpn TaxID=2738142 RepID=UPI00210353F0|nr:hypothetical protein [Massilia sp. erpn]UTY56252.1 hypothetical protein HPQ68_03030 [Massilia sp. erpn]
MLIVMTRDGAIMKTVASDAGVEAWGSLKQLSAGTQSQANQQMAQLLKLVKENEPLCITCHGSDQAIGDEGSDPGDWTWSSDDLAVLLGGLVDGYKGPILMEVCAESVTDFAAHLAVSLEKKRRLNGVWIYGYNKSISINHPFPAPAKLGQNAELAGKQVKF